jgi:GT2 family glycosyltransferase
MIKIAVVIVTFNNKKTIQPCLQSLSDSLTDYASQIVIIDNNSTDGTADILKTYPPEYKSWFNEFAYIQNSVNVGFTRAVNIGLEKLQGDFVVLLNPDVELKKETIFTLVECFAKNPQAGAVSPQLQFPDGQIQKSCRRFPRKRDVLLEAAGLTKLFPGHSKINRWKMADFDHKKSQAVEQPQGAFIMIRTQIVKKIGLLDEQFAMFFSDVDYCKRIINAGWKIWFCAETSAFHLKGHSVYPYRKEMIKTSHKSFNDYFKKYDTDFFQRTGTFFISILLKFTMRIRIFFHKSKTRE